MMHPDQIREFQRDAAVHAAAEKQAPFMAWPEDVGKIDIAKKLPFIGHYLPEGWALIDPDVLKPNRTRYVSGKIGDIPGIFVDASGFGLTTEPAMTLGEFANWIVPGFGYAVTEVGQFQVTVHVYRQVPRNA